MILNVSNQDHEGQIACLGRDLSMRASFDFAQGKKKLDYAVSGQNKIGRELTLLALI